MTNVNNFAAGKLDNNLFSLLFNSVISWIWSSYSTQYFPQGKYNCVKLSVWNTMDLGSKCNILFQRICTSISILKERLKKGWRRSQM